MCVCVCVLSCGAIVRAVVRSRKKGQRGKKRTRGGVVPFDEMDAFVLSGLFCLFVDQDTSSRIRNDAVQRYSYMLRSAKRDVVDSCIC